jgi:hypothetical protein
VNLSGQPFTYSAWIRYTNNGSEQALIAFAVAGGQGFVLFGQSPSALGIVQFTDELDASSGTDFVPSGQATFVQVGLTYDGTGNYTFYFNGSSEGGGTDLVTFHANGTPLYLSWGGTFNFNGDMKDVQIWDSVALTGAQMLTVYTKGADN